MNTEAITATCSKDQSTYCLGLIEHEGKMFESGGGCVTPTHLVCYPNDKGEVTLWDGKVIGIYCWHSSREAIFFGRRSWLGSRYYYGRAKVGNTVYAVRGFGAGMLAKGKAIKAQTI